MDEDLSDILPSIPALHHSPTPVLATSDDTETPGDDLTPLTTHGSNSALDDTATRSTPTHSDDVEPTSEGSLDDNEPDVHDEDDEDDTLSVNNGDGGDDEDDEDDEGDKDNEDDEDAQDDEEGSGESHSEANNGCGCSECLAGTDDSDEHEAPISIIPFPRPLPSDLIKPICDHLVDDTGSLLSVQASCQSGWDAATCLIYRIIDLDTDNDWESLFSPWDLTAPPVSSELRKTAADTSAILPPSQNLDLPQTEEIAGGLSDPARQEVYPSAATTSETPPAVAASGVEVHDLAASADSSEQPLPLDTTIRIVQAMNTHSTGTPIVTAVQNTGYSHLRTQSFAPDATFHPDLQAAPSLGERITTNAASSAVTPAQLRAFKAIGAARRFGVGRAPPADVLPRIAAATESAKQIGLGYHLLLRNVQSVSLYSGLLDDDVETGQTSNLDVIAQLCHPTTLCLDFGDIHFGEDSENFAHFRKMNETILDGVIISLVGQWKGLRHLNIHSTTSAYPISTHFAGITTRMYVTPPPHRATIKGDDGYAIAVQLIKLIVSYIQDDSRNDHATRFELGHINKSVHRDILGTAYDSNVPYMAWLRAGLPWTASDELETLVRAEVAGGRMNGERADQLRDRLDRFFEDDVLKFWTTGDMDKCKACSCECHPCNVNRVI